MEPPINFYTGSSEKDKRDLSRNPEKKGYSFIKTNTNLIKRYTKLSENCICGKKTNI